MTTGSIRPLDLVIVYAIPFGVVVVAFLLLALAVYVPLRLPIDFDFKYDLIRKYEAKATLPSGANQRLSFLYVAKLLVGDNCVQATFLYRVSRVLASRRLRSAAEAVHAFSKFLTHVDISPWAEVGAGLYLYHGLGTVIGKGSRIGERALICQGVTTGARPVIGDDVFLWAGAKVFGKITIGDRVEIGANAVVIRDVPPDSIAVGVPARVIPRRRGPAGEDIRPGQSDFERISALERDAAH
jgi:serine O-acetyltransferase